ncbi:ABC transporter permease [Microbacterium sp. BWT-B31]|uniref:ABC transporter permease n=1 Tax=Microbacterium sp. BWT-B31 TaxID=3232072 RepID=UPI00352759D1
MRTLDLIGTAVGNTFRSKTRTILTILAIFIGAFTLTVTNGLGTGINRYIDDTVATFGASDVMTVTKNADDARTGDGPREYDPDTVTAGAGGGSMPGTSIAVMTQDDLDQLAAIDGAEKVEPVRSLSVDFIQYDGGTRYTIGAGSIVPGQTLQLTSGAQPDDSAGAFELALPVAYVDALGFADADSAVGRTVTLAVTDATGVRHTLEAEITGVAEDTFDLTGGSGSFTPNDALATEIHDLGQTGLQADQQGRYRQARVWFDSDATPQQVDDLKAALSDAGFTGTTVADQLGTFKTVIDGIVLVLNAFAIIALLAASFGIINTLYMSVQERTREIGLMKAMGMGSGRVFSLFSLEATFIGFLGSALGVVIGMLAGTAISGVLSSTLLADLAGLQLIAFDATSIAAIVLLVMAIAFLAGTLPAARAARQDPVESLRYE